MSTAANVQSVQALSDFRAALAGFAEFCGKILDECDLELRRAQQWVTQEQPLYWRREVQKSLDQVAIARNALERAQQALLDGQRPTCLQQKKALEAAKARLRRAEEKVEMVRQAAGKLQKQVSEFAARMSQFREIIASDVPAAMALLGRMVEALEAYAAIEAPLFTRPSVAGGGTNAAAATQPAAQPAVAETAPAEEAGQRARPADSPSAPELPN